jgi:hypothetical protein
MSYTEIEIEENQTTVNYHRATMSSQKENINEYKMLESDPNEKNKNAAAM